MEEPPVNPNVNGRQFWYHGTDLRGASRILETGPRVGRNEGNLGKGFYVTPNPQLARYYGDYVFKGHIPEDSVIIPHDSIHHYQTEAWNQAEDTADPEEPGFDFHSHYHQALIDSQGATGVGSDESHEVNLFDPKDFEFKHLTVHSEGKDPEELF